MRAWRVVLAVWVVCPGVAAAAPQEALALALADCRTITDKDTAYATRWLDLTHLAPAERQRYLATLQLHVNMLSREADLVPLRVFAGGRMAAIDLRDYRIDPKVWDRLVFREPYYHQLKDVGQGRRIYFADHLPQRDALELYERTYTQAPVVAADWFFATTCLEADRGAERDGKFVGGGFGYYDFLGLKNRADFFRLSGFNPDSERSVLSEIGAIVMGHNSGVAQNDRIVIYRETEGGFLWFTLDVFDRPVDERNALAFLDRRKGFKHDAERHFGTLPNGLPVVIACNADGALQVSAPDKIGPDTSAHGKDTRIHCSKSCISCHANDFLKDIPDEVRAIYKFDPARGYNLLTTPDKEEEKYLRRSYLRDLNEKLADDRALYARAVKRCNGQAVKEAAADYRDLYERYAVEPMDADRVAAGLGVTRPEFDARLKAYRKADNLTSHVIAPLSVGRPITRVSYESYFPLLMQVVRGVPVP